MQLFEQLSRLARRLFGKAEPVAISDVDSDDGHMNADELYEVSFARLPPPIAPVLVKRPGVVLPPVAKVLDMAVFLRARAEEDEERRLAKIAESDRLFEALVRTLTTAE